MENKTMKEMEDELIDISALIDEQFGAAGTPSRIEAEEKALEMLEEEEGITSEE